jgi:hypothetical protein
MLKIFAPLLGQFLGSGRVIDGTEVVLALTGTEALDNVAYSFRAQLTSQESGNHLLNAFLVMATNESDELELQFYDTREHVHTFRLTPDDGVLTSLETHLFCFAGVRDRGGQVRISFQVLSAQQCALKFESQGKNGQWREHWNISLQRQMSGSTLKIA